MQRAEIERRFRYELRRWKQEFEEVDSKEETERAEKELNQIIKKYFPLAFAPEVCQEMEALSNAERKDIKKLMEIVDKFVKPIGGEV